MAKSWERLGKFDTYIKHLFILVRQAGGMADLVGTGTAEDGWRDIDGWFEGDLYKAYLHTHIYNC